MSVEIKSITDVITNSSNEVFTVKRLPGDNRTLEQIREDLIKFHREHTDEMGGGKTGELDFPYNEDEALELTSYEQDFKEYKEYYTEDERREEFTHQMYNILNGFPDNEAESYFTIDVDQEWPATIKYIVESLFVLRVSTIGWFKNDEGRYVEHDIKKWKKLNYPKKKKE